MSIDARPRRRASLPGCDRTARACAACERRRRARAHRGPRDLAGRGVDAARARRRPRPATRRVHRRDRVGRGAARRALEAGAEHRVDHDRGARRARRARTARSRRPAAADRRRRRRAARRARPAAGTRTSRPALAQQPRGDEPVAAVVALAADDRDGPVGRDLRDERGEARARRAPSAPATGCPRSSIAQRSVARIASASGSGSSQAGQRHRQRPPPRRPSCACASARPRRRTPSSSARAAHVAVQHDLGALAAADDLDVAAGSRPPARAPWRPPPWRRSAPRGAAPGRARDGRVGALGVGEEPLARPGRRSSARSRRSISSRSSPTPFTRP